jgi:hypothetical protein
MQNVILGFLSLAYLAQHDALQFHLLTFWTGDWLVSSITWLFFTWFSVEKLNFKVWAYIAAPCGLTTYVSKMPRALLFYTLQSQCFILSESILILSINLWQMYALWVPSWFKRTGKCAYLRIFWRRNGSDTMAFCICDRQLNLRTFSLVCNWVSPNTPGPLFMTNGRRKFLCSCWIIVHKYCETSTN